MVFTTFQYHIIISIMYSFIIIIMKFTFKAFGSLIIPITVTFTVIQKVMISIAHDIEYYYH